MRILHCALVRQRLLGVACEPSLSVFMLLILKSKGREPALPNDARRSDEEHVQKGSGGQRRERNSSTISVIC